MEDSSTNPYISEESEQIRQKVYERQSPLGRVVKWLLIATAIVAVLVGVGLFFVVPRTTAVDQPAQVKLADILQPPDQTLKRVAVNSDVGFTLSYDNRLYNSYAEVGDSSSGTDGSAAIINGETYENDDLRAARAYNYVRIRPIESVEASRSLATQPPELELFATVTDKDLTTAAANAENKGLSKLSLFVKLDSDKRQAKKVADDNTVVTIDVSKPVSTTIGSVDYQKVRYTTTNSNYRVANVKYDDCYYTIQNNQPYSVCVTGVRPTNVSAASLVEQVFDSISYQEPVTGTDSSTNDSEASKKTSYALPLARLAQATTSTKDTDESATASDDTTAAGEPEKSPFLTVTPPYYSDADSLKTIAKNQPSVVRIGTLYCADLALKYANGETATTLTDACAGNVASGVFISKDGYIATTGHAIRAQKKAAISGYINFATDQGQVLDRLQRVLDYLLKADIILQSDADYLKTGAKVGDQEALAKIENIASVIPDDYITPVKEEYTYAVQPGEKPIVINRTDSNKPTFAYSDSALSAKYVASDYDAGKSKQEVFDSATPSTDAGLLKVDGRFQEVSIAANRDIAAKDVLSTIGYTAYTDSSLTIDKIRNIPVATVSKVEQAYEKDKTQLIQTDAPVLPGNDGAPVFDHSGKLVGFAVYGFAYCPDKQCFANGTVRSTAELVKLLDTKNITPSTDSQVAKTWRQGVDTYFAANYAASTAAFKQAGSSYGFNRWADPAAKLASSLKGSSKDTSLMNQLQAVMIAALIILTVATVLLAIAFGLHRRRISQLRVGHYGAAEPQQPMQATPSIQPIMPQPLPPIQPGQAEPVAPTQPVQPIANPQPTQISVQSTPPIEPQQPVPPAQPPQNPPEDPFYK